MTSTAPVPRTITESLSFGVTVTLLDGFAFKVEFDDQEEVAPLVTDEPSPLGENRGPAPSRLLAAAVANCLASSLLHCLRKSRASVDSLEARVEATISRNAARRLRIERLNVLLDPRVSWDDRDKLARCADLFQDYCIVTESVRNGIDVSVTVAMNH